MSNDPRSEKGQAEPVAPPPDRWRPHFPYGYQAAVEGYGAVACTLLAGFSVSLIGLILPGASVRWPSATLFLLAAATVLFIAGVQCSMWARQFAVTPDEIRTWQPDYEEWRLYAEQWVHRRGFDIWNRRFAFSYRFGILVFLAGVSLTLLPPDPVSTARWGAIGVAVAGFAAEALWILSSWILAGSPTAAYNDQPDSPPEGASSVQAWPAARWVARKMIPLPRVEGIMAPRQREEDR